MSELDFNVRLVEALLFAAPEPLDSATIASRLPDGVDLAALLSAIAAHYAPRGVNLVEVGGKWQFRTAPDVGPHLRMQLEVRRKLSRASLETLAIIAYHQPVTRAEVEQIRGVSLSRGTLDLLLEAGWIRPRGHRDAPGRPALWVTTDGFLSHFSLASLDDLPGVAELRATGLLEPRAPLPAMEPTATAATDEVLEGAAETDDGEEMDEAKDNLG
ncbi:MAG: SMC-Scp complex subunit ScpB [Alphaproteobacteria bacterium]|nr:SMC-Scp complex subunit ScpB [Alphaproteobacteria bacterium]